MDYEKRTADIIKALKENNAHYIYEKMSSKILDYDVIPDSFFQLIIKVIEHPDFVALESATTFFVYLFSGGVLKYFTEAQKNKLLGILENKYEHFQSFQSCFAISELIVNLFCDERSLQALSRLKKVAADMPRRVITHGFVYFIENCPDNKLINRAFDELLQMQNDDSENVKREVQNSLSIVEKRLKNNNRED